MKPIKIDKPLLEVNKPSSQISTEYSINKKPHVITPFQFDAMNFICYQAREQISNKYTLTKKGNHPINNSNDLKIKQIELVNGAFKLDDDLFTILRSEIIEINISDLSDFTEKYGNGQKNKLISAIEDLQSVQIKVGYITSKQDDLMITKDYFNMLSRVRLNPGRKSFQIFLEPELIMGWVFNATPHTQLKIKTVAKLNSITSKKLYELLVDYAFKKYNKSNVDRRYSVEFNMLKGILNIPNNTASKVASQFKKNYLMKAVEDINSNTDMTITANNHIKQKGVVTFSFDFNFSEDTQPESPIEEQIQQNKLRLKSKAKLIKLEENGYEISDEEAWIKTDIKKYKEHYTAQVSIDNYLRELEVVEKSHKIQILTNLSEFMNASDPVVIIDKENYLIKDLSGNILTSSAKETREVILKFQEFLEKEDELN